MQVCSHASSVAPAAAPRYRRAVVKAVVHRPGAQRWAGHCHGDRRDPRQPVIEAQGYLSCQKRVSRRAHQTYSTLKRLMAAIGRNAKKLRPLARRLCSRRLPLHMQRGGEVTFTIIDYDKFRALLVIHVATRPEELIQDETNDTLTPSSWSSPPSTTRWSPDASTRSMNLSARPPSRSRERPSPRSTTATDAGSHRSECDAMRP